jgi:hypothetical protein
MRSKKSDRRKQYNYLQGGDAQRGSPPPRASQQPHSGEKEREKDPHCDADACFVDDAISNWSFESAAELQSDVMSMIVARNLVYIN